MKYSTPKQKELNNSIIYPVADQNQYLHNHITRIYDLSSHKSHICVALVVDTEFYGHRRFGITVQIKGIHVDQGIIYDHFDLQQYALQENKQLRHLPVTHDFACLNYLESYGHKVELLTLDSVHTTDLNRVILPYCQFDIYSHFALAELLMIFTGEAREKVIETILHGQSRVIEMTRRLRTYTKSKKGLQVSDAVELPLHMILDGKRYRIKLRIIDTCALHGVASYKNLASATGVKLKYKDSLTPYDLENMIFTYFNKPIEFDKYALGDLEVYSILAKNAQLFRKVYKSLDIEDYFQAPKLTIGSTVRDLFKGVLYKELAIRPDELEKQKQLSKFLSYGSSSTLKKETNTTRCLLAKVFGGRCRNNRPTDIKNDNLVADNDIAGAYGNGLRNQIYPIGKPIIEDFKQSKFNKYNTLREWLKKRKYDKDNCELVDGLWTAIISTKEIDPDNHKWETLKYPQDFLISWFDFKFSDVSKMNTDSDKVDLEISPKTGTVKILNHQVVQSVITSDFLEWLFNVCSPRQRNELLDNLYINTACYYPAYSRVNTFDELVEIWDYWQGGNTTESKKVKVKSGLKTLSSGAVITITKEPTFWIGLDLGKLIVDDLLAWRAMHKKLDGKKSPMDVLFKLCTNTLYGIFCSPYFDISNTVVGNNITARCRAMCWYMEKGHYAYQSITDGGQIDPNKVCYPKSDQNRLTATGVTNLYRLKDPTKNNLRLRPLDDYESISAYSPDDTSKLRAVKDDKEIIIDNPSQWLQDKLFTHLQNIFPNVSVLHQETTKLDIEISKDKTPIKKYTPQIGMFSFEIKDIYTKAIFHGTSNYLLSNNKQTKIAMRSYENNKPHQAFQLTETGDYVESTFYDGLSPSHFFLQQLEHPSRVKRSLTFKRTRILKIKDWKRNAETWLEKGYVCGDTIERVGLLREFSISQFTYQTIEQYQAIEKEVQRNKRKYNQSYEGYFINDDGSLNYHEMILTIDLIIADGKLSINDKLDKDRHRQRDLYVQHSESKVYEAVKQQTNQGIKVDFKLDDDSDDDKTTYVTYEGEFSDLDG